MIMSTVANRFCLSILGFAFLIAPPALFAQALQLTAEQTDAMGIELTAVQPVESVPSSWILAEVMVALDRVRYVTAPADATVVELRHVHGDVAKNDVIAVLESAEISRLQGEFLATYAKLDAAVKASLRLKSLSKIGASSIELLQEREAQVIEYQAMLDEIKQTLRVMGFAEESINALEARRKLQSPKLTLRAPAEVEMFDLKTSVGQTVEQFQPLFALGELDPITVHTPVPVELARKLVEGQVAEIQHGDRVIQAKISHMERMVDVMTQTTDVHLHLENPESESRLLPGQKVQVRFLLPTPNAFRAPLSSLAQMDGENVLFVSAAEGFQTLPIKVQATRDAQLFFSTQSPQNLNQVVSKGATAIKLAMSAGEEE